MLVLTGHKLLVKLLRDRTLDEIVNCCLFLLKQRSLLWQFKTQYEPGKLFFAPDAMPHHPVERWIHETEDEVAISSSEILAGIRLPKYECTIANHKVYNFQAVTFNLVKIETLKDENLFFLIIFNYYFPRT